MEKKESLFKNKNFTLVFLGKLVSDIGSLLYSFAVSFFILSITGNNSFIQGLYLALVGITFIVVSLFGGVIADRYNKAKIMYLCDYAKSGVILLATLLIFIFASNNDIKVILLFIVGFLNGIIAGIFSPSSGSLIPIIVPKDRLQEANSYTSILSSFQSIVGILLAGILYSLVSIYTLFIIVGICYLGSAISEMFIKYDFKESEDKLTLDSTFKDLGEGFKYLFNDKAIFSIVACIIFINFFFSPLWDNAFPYIIETDVAHSDYLLKDLISPEMWSSIFSICFAGGSLISGIVISNLKLKKPSIVSKVSLLLIVLFVAVQTVFYFIFVKSGYSINAYLIGILVLMLLMGLCLVFVNVPINTAFQKRVDVNKLGKVSAALDIGCQGLVPVATFLAGIVISSFGVEILLVCCSVGLLGVELFYLFNKNASLD